MRMQRLFSACFFFIALLFISTQVRGQDDWHIETLVSEGLAGINASITVDSRRSVHVADIDHTAYRLRYLVKTPDGFQQPVVVDDSGYVHGYVSIAVDDTDTPHICYTRHDSTRTKHALWYATLTANGWVTEKISGSGDYGDYCAIVAHDEGEAHIAYYNKTADSLEYVQRTQNQWQPLIQVDYGPDGIRDIGIARDRSNKIYISYYLYYQAGYRPPSIKLASNVSGQFRTEEVDGVSTLGGQTSTAAITIDQRNSIHISYYNAADQSYRYATRTFQGWTNEFVARGEANQAGGGTAIIADINGNPAIVYYDTLNMRMALASRSADGEWTQATIEPGQIGQHPGPHVAAVMDSMDRIHIAYAFSTSATGGAMDTDLKYASTNLPGADITIIPRRWSFGRVEAGQASTPLEVEIFNAGSALLNVQAALGVYPYDFDISAGGANPCGAFPLALPSGTGCTLSIVFTPTTNEWQHAYIPYTTNDPDTPSTGITLHGNAYEAIQFELTRLVRELPQLVHNSVAKSVQAEVEPIKNYIVGMVIVVIVVVVFGMLWKRKPD